MLDRLKRLREAAGKAVDAARTKPAEALRDMTEGMLRRATASGVPPEAASASATAAARLWTRVSPDDPLARTRLGEALVRHGRPQDAIGELSKVATTRSDVGMLAEAWLARAEVAVQQVHEAVTRIERAAHVLPPPGEPLSAQVRGVLAMAALDVLRTDLASRILDSADDEPIHLLARGRLALVNGELDRAGELIGRAVRAGVEEALPWQGLALASRGDHKGAWSLLGTLRVHGTGAPWTLLARGWVRMRQGRGDARQHLEQCVGLMPSHPGALFLLGLLSEREGDLESARKRYREATSAASSWSAPRLGLVRTAVAAGDWDEASEAAQRDVDDPDHQFLAALTLGLTGRTKEAEAAWDRLSRAGDDRVWARDVATQRAAVAWKLLATGRPEPATSAWKQVAAHASQAGSSRIMLARWAVDAARRALEADQPPTYAVEACLKAASALRPESVDLVVAHGAATLLARGPAATRTALEAAVARGASDERITGILDLIDAATKGSPVTVVPPAKATAVLDAAARARAGDARGCLERIGLLEEGVPPPTVKAVIRGARALARLAEVPSLLRQGEVDEAREVLARSIEHLPPGIRRDRATHDLAAVCAIAARRADEQARQAGEPPPQEAVIRWQEALGHWVALASSPAYFAELSKRVLELDDPRLGPRDVEELRVSLDAVAAGLPALTASEALTKGQHRRARFFVSLIVGAPIGETARARALSLAMAPLTREALGVSDAAKRSARERPPGELLQAYRDHVTAVTSIVARMSEAAPDGIGPVADARDDMALSLVAFFENLHDRALERAAALGALGRAADLAASETLRAELRGKRERVEARR